MNNSSKKLLSKGWSKIAPKTKKTRKIMHHKCGKKCFLGKKMSFPICNKGTCKINHKGIYSAYIRARQYKHKNVASTAKKLLKKYGYKFKK